MGGTVVEAQGEIVPHASDFRLRSGDADARTHEEREGDTADRPGKKRTLPVGRMGLLRRNRTRPGGDVSESAAKAVLVHPKT